MIYVKAYLGFMFTFLVIDSVWINLVVMKLYHQDVPHLLSATPNIPAAVIFYLAYAAGSVWFAIRPYIEQRGSLVLLNGALLGALTYATFTMTNYAVLEGWTTKIAITDILWGATLTAVSCYGGYLATRLGR